MPALAQDSIVIAGLLGAGGAGGHTAHPVRSGVTEQTYENSVYVNTNAQRDRYDRASLKGAKCLDMFAERQAKAMAQQRRIYHQNLRPILDAMQPEHGRGERRLRLPQRQVGGLGVDALRGPPAPTS